MIYENRNRSDRIGRRRFMRNATISAAGFLAGSLAKPFVSGVASAAPRPGVVSLALGTDHRQATLDTLKPLEQEVAEAIGNRQVVIKPNVGQVRKELWLNACDAGQLRGILDFLRPIYSGTVVIAEGTAAAPLPGGPVNTFMGYENFGYLSLEREYNVRFIDLNDHPTIKSWIQAPNGHPMAVNLIELYLDPNIYLISATRLKNSGGVIATLSLKNVVMGAPINHYRQKAAEGRNEKTFMHSWGRRGLSYNIFRLATMGIQPDLAVLDGLVGMEGNGPVQGTPVEHGVALASTDWLAADRLAVELMGYDYRLLKYLEWCGAAGMGEDDLSNISVIGPDWRNHVVPYKHHQNYDQQVAWIYEDEGK